MTAHQSVILPDMQVQSAAVADGAPPRAPMHMPKQVLTAEPGALRRGVARLLSALPSGRHRPG